MFRCTVQSTMGRLAPYHRVPSLQWKIYLYTYLRFLLLCWARLCLTGWTKKTGPGSLCSWTPNCLSPHLPPPCPPLPPCCSWQGPVTWAFGGIHCGAYGWEVSTEYDMCLFVEMSGLRLSTDSWSPWPFGVLAGAP